MTRDQYIKAAQNRKELSINYWAANNGATAFCPEKLKGTQRGYEIVRKYRDEMMADFYSYKLDKEPVGEDLKPWEREELKNDRAMQDGQDERDKAKMK